jgi:hypothetical protein
MRQYLLDSAPLAGYLHGRKPFVELITPLIQQHQAATSIMVYAEVIEYLKGLPDFTHRKKQLQMLLREVYPYFLTYAILERYADIRRAMRPPNPLRMSDGWFSGGKRIRVATAAPHLPFFRCDCASTANQSALRHVSGGGIIAGFGTNAGSEQ